jgi:hypothetical protein
MSATHDIQERTFEFARRIIDFCRYLADSDYAIRQLGSQLLKAGTSIGANLEEGRRCANQTGLHCKGCHRAQRIGRNTLLATIDRGRLADCTIESRTPH